MPATSPYLNLPPRDELEVRRAKLATSLRAEGANEETVARLATLKTAEAMQEHESLLICALAKWFMPNWNVK